MSVIIKDMTMPNSCTECHLKIIEGTPLYGIDHFCTAAKMEYIWHGHLEEDYKPEWCPLEEYEE